MSRTDYDQSRRRTPRRSRKPYNDDYKEDSRASRRSREAYDDDYAYSRGSGRYYDDDPYEDRYDSRYEDPDEDVRIYENSRSRRKAAAEDSRDSYYDEPRAARRSSRSSARRSQDERADYEPRRQRSSRSARPQRRRRRSRGLLIPLIVVLLFVVVAAGGIGYLSSLWGKVDSANFKASDVVVNSDLPESIQRELKDYRTIMIFGVDSRDNSTLQSGTLADSNIICAINKSTGDVKLLSIYRDTYVETTGGEHMKLTEVYSKYGAEEQLSTINKNFDMHVTEYVTVNWKAVALTIDKLGGIDLELSSAECEGINKYINEVIQSTGIESSKISVEDGTQHVDGIQAVTYCRLRKGLGDDYKRTERQRTVINKTLSKAKQAGIPTVINVCNEVFPGISSSLSLPEVLTLAGSMGKFNIADSAGFPFENEAPNTGRNFLYPVTLSSNVTELHAYLYNNTDYAPSETVRALSEAVAEESGFYGN